MKKIQLVALALVATLGMSAENSTKLRVWISGAKVEYPLTMVDSLTFYTTATEDPDVPLADGFSVSANKKVLFSGGNLQYTQSTDTWAFATNQYDVIGEANADGETLADKIDLFGWSGSTGSAKWGVSTSTEYNKDYSGDFADWGQNIGDGSTWRTLTGAEWTYLRETRTNAAKLMGVARIQISEDYYANGLILLPDNWTCPDGITFKSGFASENSEQAYADYQTFTLLEWLRLEVTGAVFLPASGSRDGSSISNVQSGGDYWSATPFASGYAFYLNFYSTKTSMGFNERSHGRAVRLVQDIND
ncbi:MAG: hypothetical protein ACI4BD_08055 [Paludibacteraceae bacterium]